MSFSPNSPRFSDRARDSCSITPHHSFTIRPKF
jgi:hypothetical protein